VAATRQTPAQMTVPTVPKMVRKVVLPVVNMVFLPCLAECPADPAPDVRCIAEIMPSARGRMNMIYFNVLIIGVLLRNVTRGKIYPG
jgi:hypothetical protein